MSSRKPIADGVLKASKFLTVAILFGLAPVARAATAPTPAPLCVHVLTSSSEAPTEAIPEKYYPKTASSQTAAKRNLYNGQTDLQRQIWNAEDLRNFKHANALKQSLKQHLLYDIPTKPMENIGGSNDAIRVVLGDNVQAIQKGYVPFLQSPGAEVAAYKLNIFLDDFVHVPMTIKRTIDGKIYSLQVFLPESRHSVIADLSAIYVGNVRFLDFLTDNTDRKLDLAHFGFTKTDNVLNDEVTNDNGIGFRTELALSDLPKPYKTVFAKELAWSLNLVSCCGIGRFERNSFDMNKVRDYILTALPERKIYEKVKATPNEEFVNLFKDEIGPVDIEAFIKRKDFFIEIVEQWLAEGNIYPAHLSSGWSSP